MKKHLLHELFDSHVLHALHDLNDPDGFDALIRESAKSTQISGPPPRLTNSLKAELYARENAARREIPVRTISLWYLPMVINCIIFGLLGILSFLLISDLLLLTLAVLGCAYAAAAGIVLTVIGMKRTNMREECAIHIEKRGALT